MTDQEIIDTFPELFPETKQLECGPGWNQIVYDMCKEIQRVANEKKSHIYVLQIKEKFGGLRVYLSSYFDEIDEIIDRAEELAYVTCEICGGPGKTYNDGWFETLCEEHAKGRLTDE